MGAFSAHPLRRLLAAQLQLAMLMPEVVHCVVARRLGHRRRLACLEVGESIRPSTLKFGGIEALKQAWRLSIHATCRWEWADEREPLAVGAVLAPAC